MPSSMTSTLVWTSGVSRGAICTEMSRMLLRFSIQRVRTSGNIRIGCGSRTYLLPVSRFAG